MRPPKSQVEYGVVTDTVPMQQPTLGSSHQATPPRRRRGYGCLFFLIVLCVAGVATYLFTGPYRTLKGLQTAIAFDDANALNDYVDFPTLRQNLKQQINARTNTQLNAAIPNGIFSQLATGIANSVTDAAVDSLVTPTGLNKLVNGASVVAGQLQGGTTGTPAERFDHGSGSFETTDRFAYTIKPTPSTDLTLILTRQSLNWRLTNVLLPPAP